MDALSPVLIAKALDGLSMRYQATAQNIANGNTPDYRPIAVQFEDALKAAADQGDLAAIDRVTPKVVDAPRPRFADELRIDLELATATQTAGRYAALLNLLGRQFSVEEAALKGGQA